MINTNGQAVAAGDPGSEHAAPAFEVHVRGVTQRVRTALADALASVGADPKKPQSIARQLKLDKSLAWKAAKIVTDDDPFAAIPRMPGRSGVRILIESLEAARSPEAAVEELRDAMAEFERMVETHAGSRETLAMMLANVSKDGQRERDEALRKLAFTGNSSIWGVQARVRLAVQFVVPNADKPGFLDLGVVSGLIDFKRLRQDVPWTMAQIRIIDDKWRPLPDTVLIPMDPSVPQGEAPLMKEFCSPWLPPLRAQATASGMTRLELSEGAVGITGSATCITGWFDRGIASIKRDSDNQYGEHMAYLTTPCEVMYHDLYVHRSITCAMNPGVFVYGMMPGGPIYPQEGRDRGLLPIGEPIIQLGAGPPDLTTPEVPRYRQIVEAAMARMGFAPVDFRGFRHRLRYPPIPSLALIRHDLEPA